ncbi:MAG TPA: right-handed parallel beta-helix repeat-containing protein, partial [Armatimonadota bacterium]
MFARFARRSVLLLLALLSLAPLSRAAVLRVTKAGSATPDGQTWATAYGSVQAAVNAGANGDEVWVAAGKYVENITLKDGVSLYGGFAGTETARSQRDWTANESILDGNGAGRVVTGSAIGSSTTLDGFTYQNGPKYIDSVTYGGGMYVIGSATISNNIFRANSATLGGGLAVTGSPTIRNNVMSGNRAFSAGGVYVDGGEAGGALIEGNTITGNRADSSGGGGYFINCVIRNNAFTGNIGYYSAIGGATVQASILTGNVISANTGLAVWGESSLIERNWIESNTGGFGTTGALNLSNSTARSNVILRNSSVGGCAVGLSDGCTLTNNTITANTCSFPLFEGQYSDGVIAIRSGTLVPPTISNNVIVGNDCGINAPGTARYRNNLVSGNLYFNYYTTGSWHQNDISGTPTFVNAAADDYRLTIDSVGIDAGYDAPLTADALDFAGNPRRQGEHSDLGAYEYAAVADVAMTPTHGTFLPPLDIALSCPTPDAPIHYTLNGAAPTASDPVVPASGKITLNAWA